MILDDQMPEVFQIIISEQTEIFHRGRRVEDVDKIPDTPNIPIEDPNHWLKIPDVICIFVDMKGSTKLSATNHDKSTAGAYQLFTRTAVRLFSEFEAPYIDVRGDGVLAIFDKNQPYRAITATITFQTFAQKVFIPKINQTTGLEIKAHLGIDQNTVLARKMGFKRYRGRSDRQNEVWAGKPVNMAAKLASLSNGDQVIVSDRYFRNIDHELVQQSCGCQRNARGQDIPGGEKQNVWSSIDFSNNNLFDFDTGYSCKTYWCQNHGKRYCEELLQLDEN